MDVRISNEVNVYHSQNWRVRPALAFCLSNNSKTTRKFWQIQHFTYSMLRTTYVQHECRCHVRKSSFGHEFKLIVLKCRLAPALSVTQMLLKSKHQRHSQSAESLHLEDQVGWQKNKLMQDVIKQLNYESTCHTWWHQWRRRHLGTGHVETEQASPLLHVDIIETEGLWFTIFEGFNPLQWAVAIGSESKHSWWT